MSSTYGNFQIRVLSEIVRLLRQDSYLKSRVGDRIHPSHISTLENPSFPCITISTRLSSDPSFREVQHADMQIDVWSKKGLLELWAIYSDHDSATNSPVGVRALLNSGRSGEAFGFDLPEAVVSLCRERDVTDNLYEDWSRTHHLAATYQLVFAAKRI